MSSHGSIGDGNKTVAMLIAVLGRPPSPSNDHSHLRVIAEGGASSSNLRISGDGLARAVRLLPFGRDLAKLAGHSCLASGAPT